MTLLLCLLLAAESFPLRRMAEPLLGESITDIDGDQAGEVELDATGLFRRPGALWNTGLEIEWRALTRLGLALEAAGSRQGSDGRGIRGSFRPSASFVLLHDAARDLHLMADATARLFENEVDAEPGEPALPAAFSLRGAMRRGTLTLRGAIGAGVGGHRAHDVPLRAQAAVLLEAPFGFWGIETDGDFARSSPWVIALQTVLGSGSLQVGAALTWEPGVNRLGALVRLILQFDAE